MDWIEPKTDWISSDYFNADPDWNRITANIRYLGDAFQPYFLDINIETMDAMDDSDLPFARRLNSVEDNLDALGKKTYNFADFPEKKQQFSNQRIWDYQDLNRIESYILRLKQLVEKTDANTPKMAFRMGAGIIGSFI